MFCYNKPLPTNNKFKKQYDTVVFLYTCCDNDVINAQLLCSENTTYERNRCTLNEPQHFESLHWKEYSQLPEAIY